MPDPSAGPAVSGAMNPIMRANLQRSFPEALDKVRSPACAALFEGLRMSGFLALIRTTYFDGEVADRCQSWMQANTNVNSYHVYLCHRWTQPGFNGANTLIHEALHTAGLTERPTDQDAMTSAEINQMVLEHCGS